MPYPGQFPLGGNGDILMDIVRRLEILEARARVIQNGSIVVADSNNKTRVVIGQLPSGDYGVEVLDPNGNGRELLTTYQSFVELNPSGNQTWQSSSTLPALPNGGPSVTAYLGASGDALITVCATIWVSGGNGGFVGLQVDGTNVGNYELLQCQSLSAVSGSVTFQMSKFPGMATVTPNSTHTFAPTIYTANSVQSFFQGIGISVEPI